MGAANALLLIAATFVIITDQVDAIPREILVEEDGGTSGTSSLKTDDDLDRLCHVEYQVMKRTIGRCVKLGRSATGCVSGTYLHPFHPECL